TEPAAKDELFARRTLWSAEIRSGPSEGVRCYEYGIIRECSAPSLIVRVVTDLVGWVILAFRSRQSLHAEVLFLRRQLALYVERGIKPRRIDAVTRISLAILSRFFNWRDALVLVRPETMIRWHRAGRKLFWRLKSRPGRPPIPQPLQALIPRLAHEHPWSGDARIANDLCYFSPRPSMGYHPLAPVPTPVLRGARPPRDDDPLAPRRSETVLAPEVPTWPTADSSTITGSDPPHGEREPFVGRGTHRQ